MKLSAADLEHFRALLLEERERVVSEMDYTEREIKELQSQTAEEHQDENVGGGASFTLDREIDRAIDANAEHILREVDAALKRLDDGTYGACTNCGTTIRRERLEALPYASNCIEHA